MALLSAALGVLLLVVVILFIFIQHYLDPSSLRTSQQFDGESESSVGLSGREEGRENVRHLRLCVWILHHAAGALANDTWLVFLPFAPLKTTSASLLILAFVTVMLSIISLLMLGHLLGFHFYLCKKLLDTSQL